MTSREEVVSNLSSALRQYQPAMKYYPGFLGLSDAVDAPVLTARENYLWVRYPYSNTPAVPVLCVASNIPRVAGYKVTVGKLPWMTQDEILWPSDFRVDGVSPTDALMPPGSTTGYSPYPSAANFMYLGLDPLYINWRQITPLGVFPLDNASMNVQVWAGYIPRPSGDVFVSTQAVDMTSHIPVSGARYALVSFDATGTVVVTDGSINAGGFSALTAADIPATPAGNWRSCAVVLYAGQTALVETRSEIDFYDLRFPEESMAGSVSPSDILLADTHILVGNGSGVAADVAMSNDATIANTGALTLKNTGPGATGPIGSATVTPIITIDAQGRVTALSSATISAGHTIQDEGVSLTKRTNLNFTGTGIEATDDAANDASVVTIDAVFLIYNEIQIGTGGTTYYLANVATANTVRAFVNGIRQPVADDDTNSDVVTFIVSPAAGETLIFDYEAEVT